MTPLDGMWRDPHSVALLERTPERLIAPLATFVRKDKPYLIILYIEVCCTSSIYWGVYIVRFQPREFPMETIWENNEQKLPDSQFEFEIRALLFPKVSNGPVVENPRNSKRSVSG